MADEWRETTLGEFLTLQRGHDLTEPERREGHVPVMGSAGQNGFHDTAIAKGPGIVIGRSGASFGQVHFSAVDYWPHNTALYVTDFKGNDPHFAFYFLKALDFDRYNSGSAQPSLNRNFIYPIPICVPTPAIQRAIAGILREFDEKIELNHCMNETLEAMVRALFKSWFVDFDPVHAKAAGRKPEGMDAQTAALFPNAFQDSPLGKIPKGWIPTAVYECAEYLNGLAFKSDDFSSERLGLPILKIAELKDGIDAQTKFTEKEIQPQYRIHKGDLLFSWSGSPGTSIDTFIWASEAGWLNQHIFKVSAKPPWTTSTLFVLLKHLKPRFIEIARDKQTTGLGHVTVKDLKRMEVVQASNSVSARFNDLVDPIFKRMLANLVESQKLTETRNSLLPKLLSGALKVRDGAIAS